MTIYRKDYQPPHFTTTHMDLDVRLDPEVTIVKSQLKIVKNGTHNEPLVLHGEDMILLSICLNGQTLNESLYQWKNKTLSIQTNEKFFTLDIEVEIHPKENQTLMGLYTSRGIFCTQCEPHGFRRITFSQDRPDVLTIFSTKLSAHKSSYPTLLSNGNLTDSGTDGNGHWAQWHDPFPKPSYLFAIVAGEFECLQEDFITMSGRKVSVEVYVEPGKTDQANIAMASLLTAMKWDEDRYGREYDLDRFMVVSCQDFNSGAMENKGLNIFNSRYILANPETATDQDALNVASVIAHEYFHNWTGNRVTVRDWFQLSLKEGLTVFRDQNFSMDTVDPVTVRIDEVNVLRSAQFREDAGPMSHPVRPDQYQSMKNFYTATVYNKGAEVIRMIETILGVANFRKGLDAYFNQYDGQAVTIDDILEVFEKTCDIDLSQFKLWYSQSGTPEIDLSTSYNTENKTFELTLQQHIPETADQSIKHPMHVPIRVGFLSKSGSKLPVSYHQSQSHSHLLELKERKQTFYFTDVSEKPILSINQGFSSPIKKSTALDDAVFLYQYDFDALNRWDHGQYVMQDIVLNHYNSQDVSSKHTVLCDGMRAVLEDTALSMAQKAQLITWPSLSILIQAIDHVDPLKLHQSLKSCMVNTAKSLESELLNLYQNAKARTQGNDMEAIGARRLANLCLYYLMHANTNHAHLAQAQYEENTGQMTLLMGALQAVNPHECVQRSTLMSQFKQTFSRDPLVMDKWFALSAMMPSDHKIDQLNALTEDSCYRSDNPNCIRSLWLMFAGHQIPGFHAHDSSGYNALIELVAYWDIRNPQLAAQLIQPFMSWEQYDQATATRMRRCLEKLQESAGSTDLIELLSKALAAPAPS